MQIYNPGASPAWLADLFGCQSDQCSGEGLVICGLPLGSSPDQIVTDDSRPEMPVGTVAFQQKYLQCRLEQLQHKARTLEEIAESLPSIGRHVALHILHACLLASCMYLLRGLHVEATLPWSTRLDELFQSTWLHVCNINRLSNAQWQMVTASPALGGLGLLRCDLKLLCTPLLRLLPFVPCVSLSHNETDLGRLLSRWPLISVLGPSALVPHCSEACSSLRMRDILRL